MTAHGVERASSNVAGQGVDYAALSAARVELCRLAAMAGLVVTVGTIGGEIAGASAAAGGAPPHAPRAPLIGIETGRKKFSQNDPVAKEGARVEVGAGTGRASGGAGHRARAGSGDAAARGQGALA